jgi:alginate O-acetyltransferase complex protein AlgI
LDDLSTGDAWLGALAYTVQLYYDFAGYSNMAIGLGMMMGFKFIENFDHPYISRSITEFWRRWHISLSAWLRDYLYIPLGGNKKGHVRTYVNLLITMVLGGLWHGANWTFIVWGAWHGAILAIERFLGIGTAKNETAGIKVYARQIFRLAFTFLLVIIGWIMFRAESVGQAFSYYEKMFLTADFAISDAFAWQITGLSMTALIIGLAWVFIAPLIEYKTAISFKKTRNIAVHSAIIILFVISVIKLGAENYSPFLYFQF